MTDFKKPAAGILSTMLFVMACGNNNESKIEDASRLCHPHINEDKIANHCLDLK